MSIARVWLPFFGLLGALSAQVVTVTPERPKWGDTLQISYDSSAPGAELKVKDKVWVAATVSFEDYSSKRSAGAMQVSGTRLGYSLPVPEGACLITLSFVTPDDYDSKASAEVMIYRPNGQPARDANHRLMARHAGDALERYFRQEIQLYPDNFAAWHDRWWFTDFHGKANEIAAVRADLEKIADPQREQSLGWLYAMTYGHIRLGEGDQAGTFLRRMIEQFPESILTSDALSDYIIRSSGKAKDQARQWERELVASHPESEHAAATIGTLAGDKNFPYDAVLRVTRARIQREPDDPSPYLAMAKASLAHDRDRAQALAGLQTALGLLIEGRFHVRFDAAGTLTRRRLDEAYRLRSEIRLAQGEFADALADAKAAESFERDINAAGYLLEGRIWWALQDWRRAETAWLAAWRRDPKPAETQLRQAYEAVRGSADGFPAYLAANRQSAPKDVQMAFPFEAISLDGKRWSLVELKGKTMVLNFWFTGCLPCRQEIPVLNQLVDQYKDVVFLAFAIDNATLVSEFVKQYPFRYELIADAQRVADGFSIGAYPTHMLINSAGEVAFKAIGDVEALKAALARSASKR